MGEAQSIVHENIHGELLFLQNTAKNTRDIAGSKVPDSANDLEMPAQRCSEVGSSWIQELSSEASTVVRRLGPACANFSCGASLLL